MMTGGKLNSYTPVDGCPYTLAEVFAEVLPRHLEALERSRAVPLPMTEFTNCGVKEVLDRRGLARDFAGCYTLLDGRRPIYVGISRTVFKRLREHVCAKTHNSATLAYLMATRWSGNTMRRAEAMGDPEFQREFQQARDYLRSLSAAFVEIKDPFVRHVFEAYAAQAFGTGEWNTFETH